MTLYEQILELFPLVSYEENRVKNGYVTFIGEADGTFAVTNEPSGPPNPEWSGDETGPRANMRPVADAILILGK